MFITFHEQTWNPWAATDIPLPIFLPAQIFISCWRVFDKQCQIITRRQECLATRMMPRKRRLEESFSCRGSPGGETPSVMVQAGEPPAKGRWVVMAHELQEKAGLLRKSQRKLSGQVEQEWSMLRAQCGRLWLTKSLWDKMRTPVSRWMCPWEFTGTWKNQAAARIGSKICNKLQWM